MCLILTQTRKTDIILLLLLYRLASKNEGFYFDIHLYEKYEHDSVLSVGSSPRVQMCRHDANAHSDPWSGSQTPQVWSSWCDSGILPALFYIITPSFVYPIRLPSLLLA
ncbi:hypothetical protein XENOCAPTIV_024165 [Xenoophorus captivus]|uniref:Uncharacterized protein n=1 Tax=Xenoophorus captivus TaxID=1517983 RepID=A0ABV0QTC5_9TELE